MKVTLDNIGEAGISKTWTVPDNAYVLLLELLAFLEKAE